MTELAATELNEACLVEGNKFVASTAKFTSEWDIIPLRPDLCPEKYVTWGCLSLIGSSIQPNFDTRKSSLMSAAQSTCYIAVRPDRNPDTLSPGYQYGTAFFVSSTVLITAAHLVPDNKRRIVGQLPGTQHATFFAEDLFKKPPPFSTFECKCLGTGLPNADLAVLQVTGSYRAKVFLEIDYGGLKSDDPVDVVGYPGQYSYRDVRNMHPGLIDGDLVEDVFELFPQGRLLVTYGLVVLGGFMPRYRLSTVSGMSGSPVIMNGKVKGIVIVSPPFPNESNQTAVHVGTRSISENRCVSFGWIEVKKLLEVHGLLSKSHPICRPLINIDNGTESTARKGKTCFKFLPCPCGGSPESTQQDDEYEPTASKTQIRHKLDRMSKSVILDSPY